MADLSGSFTPIKLGETRNFIVRTSRSANVGIRCFIRPPNPPVFKECSWCGSFSELNDGDEVEVTASAEAFQGDTGGIELSIIEPGMLFPKLYELQLYEDRDEEPQELASV